MTANAHTGAPNDAGPAGATPCASDSDAGPVGRHTLGPGWKLCEKESEGFALGLPPTWEQIDVDQATLDASLDAISEHNPRMAEMLKGQARNLLLSDVKFFAFDLGPAAPSTANLPSLWSITAPSSLSTTASKRGSRRH